MRVKPQQDPSEAISNLRNKGLAYGDSMLSNRFRLLEFVEIKKDVGNNVKERNGFYPSRPIVLKPDERKNASKETASASAPQQNESKKDEEKQQEDAMVKKNLLKSLSLVLSNLNRSHLYLLYASLAESSPAISAVLEDAIKNLKRLITSISPPSNPPDFNVPDFHKKKNHNVPDLTALLSLNSHNRSTIKKYQTPGNLNSIVLGQLSACSSSCGSLSETIKKEKEKEENLAAQEAGVVPEPKRQNTNKTIRIKSSKAARNTIDTQPQGPSRTVSARCDAYDENVTKKKLSIMTSPPSVLKRVIFGEATLVPETDGGTRHTRSNLGKSVDIPAYSHTKKVKKKSQVIQVRQETVHLTYENLSELHQLLCDAVRFANELKSKAQLYTAYLVQRVFIELFQ